MSAVVPGVALALHTLSLLLTYLAICRCVVMMILMMMMMIMMIMMMMMMVSASPP